MKIFSVKYVKTIIITLPVLSVSSQPLRKVVQVVAVLTCIQPLKGALVPVPSRFFSVPPTNTFPTFKFYKEG